MKELRRRQSEDGDAAANLPYGYELWNIGTSLRGVTSPCEFEPFLLVNHGLLRLNRSYRHFLCSVLSL